MHLLLAQKGTIADGEEAVDLGQSPADILFLSAADTELASIAAAQTQAGPDAPSLRAANLMQLRHPMSVDTYVERTARHARLIVIRALGGASYFAYALEALHAAAVNHGGLIAVLPGDDKPDEGLSAFSNVAEADREQLWRYLIEGGPGNMAGFLACCRAMIEGAERPGEAVPLLKAGVWRRPLSSRAAEMPAQRIERSKPRFSEGANTPPTAPNGLSPPPGGRMGSEPAAISTSSRRREGGEALAEPGEGAGFPKRERGAPLFAICFYRALVQSGQTAPVEALCQVLEAEGARVLPVFVSSLKDPVSVATVERIFAESPPDVVINATGFAVSTPGGDRKPTALESTGAPVLQAIFSSSPEEAWTSSSQGLSARDLAMNVALPEVDGRVLARAVSFKSAETWDPRVEANIVTHKPRADRVAFTVRLALAWARLRRTPAAERRIAFVLANYPNRDGRLANGVGLDTPAGTIEALRAMQTAGYPVADLPLDGDALIRHLADGPTNAAHDGRVIRETIALKDYKAFLEALPKSVQDEVVARWGEPEADPFFLEDRAAFALPLARFGGTLVGIQPARGYNIDPKETYHAPDLVPPHGYIAFYAYLRQVFGAHAIVHMGKHGNLEWLPGKALALSETCYPEAVLGPLPHVYPFIVNDPGEGSQAKRRAAAVIIDHLTPPLTRAETYGPLKDLEALVDEYYEAAGGDPRRLKYLKTRILDLVRDTGLNLDAGIGDGDPDDTALEKLDAYLCELKEMQIRDGLHVFGRSPDGRLLTDLVTALARVPRGSHPGAASLQRAIARDALAPRSPVPAEMSVRGSGVQSARGQAPATGNAVSSSGASCNPGSSPGQALCSREESRERDGAAVSSSPRPGEGVEALAGPSEGADAPFDPLDCDLAAPWVGPRPAVLADISADPWRTNGDAVERIEILAAKLIAGELSCPDGWTATRAVLHSIEASLKPAVAACGRAEIDGLITALDGRFVAPGPSGAPTRGRPDVLPTGRNFFSVDSRAVPTEAAWELGRKSAELLITRYTQDHGEWPTSFALTAWGTSNMRTGGDDIAQAMALIGAKPVWDHASRRVTGYEIIPLALLGRPRVDVTLRISGFFRDAFPDQIALFDRAVRAIGALEEDEAENPIAARMRAERARLAAAGIAQTEAARRAGYRVFGSKPGAYGAGLQALIDEKGWVSRADLAEAYMVWGSYAYGAGEEGKAERGIFEERLRTVEAVVQNQDNREHDILDSDDYYQFEGGMTAAVESVKGMRPAVFHNDHSRPERPVVRTLGDEIGRVVRARAVNPKWIEGVMRHGYKGAFEMAATVDYLFAFAATTGAVRDHHFEAVYNAYLNDERVRAFIADKNPAALAEMADRLREAIERGLWTPRSNSAKFALEELAGGRT